MKMSVTNHPSNKQGREGRLLLVVSALFCFLYAIIAALVLSKAGVLGFLVFAVVPFALVLYSLRKDAKKTRRICMITAGLIYVVGLSLAFSQGDRTSLHQSIVQEYNIPVKEAKTAENASDETTVVYSHSHEGKSGALRLKTSTEGDIRYEYYSFDTRTTPGTGPWGFFTNSEVVLDNIEPITEEEIFKQGALFPKG